MNITEIVRQRYSTKSFDLSKKIAAEDFAHIEAALRNSPSSVNMQPWHFIIADDEAGKARIAKSTEKLPYNTPKITHASHVVVFAARVYADDDYVAENVRVAARWVATLIAPGASRPARGANAPTRAAAAQVVQICYKGPDRAGASEKNR